MIHIDLMDTMDITDLISLLRCSALLLEFNYCWFCSCYSNSCYVQLRCECFFGLFYILIQWFSTFLVERSPKIVFQWLEEPFFTYLHRRVNIYCRS